MKIAKDFEGHIDTVEYANKKSGGLTSSELIIVKIGVKAPDKWYSADYYDGTEKNPWKLDLRMFHAITSRYNYVKVYEYIMNMAIKCNNKGISEAQKMNYPDNYAGDYNECAIVKPQLNKDCIINILKGMKNEYGYSFTNHRAALIMLGFAMHIMGDTYAHRAYVNYGGNYILSQNLPQVSSKIKNTDNTEFYRCRFIAAQKACANILACWNNDCPPNCSEYDIEGYNDQFKLEKLYTFSRQSPNGLGVLWSENIRDLSYAD